MTDELIDPDDDDIEGALGALGADPTETTEPAPTEDAGSDDFGAVVDEVVAESEGQPRGPDGKFLPKTEAETAKAETVDPDPAAAAPAPPDPFAAYTPFQFKVDGHEVALDGVRANDTHVVIPRELWDRELRPNYLGSREAWQQERGQWGQREQHYRRELQSAQERVAAITDEVNALLSDPERLVKFVENYEREAPLLRERMRANEAERQLQYVRQVEQQQQQQALYAQLEEAGADAFEREVDALLKDPALQVLAPSTPEEREDLLVELWRAGGPQLIHLTPDGRAVAGVAREPLYQELSRRAQFIARREAQWKKATTTEQRNAAAVSPPATSPQTAPIPKATRSTTAAPTRAPSPRPAPVQAHRITDDDRAAWREDFASVFDD